MSREETKSSLISEVLKWVSISKGGKLAGYGIIILMVSALLIFYVTLTPPKAQAPPEIFVLWFIGEMLLIAGVTVLIVGVLVIVLGLISLFRGYRSKGV